MAVEYHRGITLLRDYHRLLKTLTYPVNVNHAGFTPEAIFLQTDEDGEPVQSLPIEYIALDADFDSEEVWSDTGHRVGSLFEFDIIIRTAVEGVPGDEALQRAEELGQVVEDGLRDQTTGLPTGLAVGLDAPQWLRVDWRLSGVRLKAFQVPKGGIGFTYTLTYRNRTIS